MQTAVLYLLVYMASEARVLDVSRNLVVRRLDSTQPLQVVYLGIVRSHSETLELKLVGLLFICLLAVHF